MGERARRALVLGVVAAGLVVAPAPPGPGLGPADPVPVALARPDPGPRGRGVAGAGATGALGGSRPGPRAGPGTPRLPAAALGTHRWPVEGALVDTFRMGPNPYGAGHRGIDLAVDPGTPVRAMAAGTVGFAGVVAGRAWVSVDHPAGLRTTVGPLATVVVRHGDRVVRSGVLGTAAATAHADHRVARTGRLHVSARVAGAYLDPTPLVGRWVPTLVPAPPARPPTGLVGRGSTDRS